MSITFLRRVALSICAGDEVVVEVEVEEEAILSRDPP